MNCVDGFILENDWLEAIIALPLNLLYNTGIDSGALGPLEWSRRIAHRYGNLLRGN